MRGLEVGSVYQLLHDYEEIALWQRSYNDACLFLKQGTLNRNQRSGPHGAGRQSQ